VTKGLLDGVVVLDLGRVLAAPLAGQYLADMGADVLKIERPNTGDDARAYGPPFLQDTDGNNLDQSAFFLSANRNKKSVTIDYAKPAGLKILKDLIAGADVLIENFKAGALAKYGLDFASVHQINPRLVYCSISGFGQEGPLAHRPGFDGVFQAMSGLMSLIGQPDGSPGEGPLRVGVSIVDVITAYQAVIGILAALRESERTGKGQQVDVALLDSAIASLSHVAQLYLMTGEVPARQGNGSFAGAPSSTYQCAEGSIYIVGGANQHFAALCRTIDRPDLIQDKRFLSVASRIAHRQVLNEELCDEFKGRTAIEWTDLLDKAGVPAGPVNDLKEVFEDPQVRSRSMRRTVPHPKSGTLDLLGNPLNFSANPIENYAPPPELGADTERVLTERLGLSGEDIAALRQQGTI